MLAGRPYISSGPELFGARQAAKELVRLNALRPGQTGERDAILRRLFGRIGEPFYVEPFFRCDYGSNILIGVGTSTRTTTASSSTAPPSRSATTSSSAPAFTSTRPDTRRIRSRETRGSSTRPATIGNNVWLGGRVVVTPGVTIGDNAVIGAGSVVTRDVPPSVIAAGNPCRVLRAVTDEDRKFYFRGLPLDK